MKICTSEGVWYTLLFPPLSQSALQTNCDLLQVIIKKKIVSVHNLLIIKGAFIITNFWLVLLFSLPRLFFFVFLFFLCISGVLTCLQIVEWDWELTFSHCYLLLYCNLKYTKDQNIPETTHKKFKSVTNFRHIVQLYFHVTNFKVASFAKGQNSCS